MEGAAAAEAAEAEEEAAEGEAVEAAGEEDGAVAVAGATLPLTGLTGTKRLHHFLSDWELILF